jgi:LysM repeat protein
METYEVKPGDTLMKIAFSLYGDIDRWKDLQEWNAGKITKLSALKVGTRLQYEAPLTPFSPEEREHAYTIRQGDTLAGIADEVYGRRAKYKKLQNYNSSLIKDPNRIFAGFKIFYDITAEEMAEAEARRKERMAAQSAGPSMAPSALPSAITPPAAMAPPPAAPIAASPAPPAPAPAMVGPAPPAPASTTAR